MFQTYKNLSRRTRIAFGAGVIVWGVVGLYISDFAEEKLGMKPTEEDIQKLRDLAPHITTLERRAPREK